MISGRLALPFALLVTSAAVPVRAAPNGERAAQTQQCLDCHENEGLTLTFGDGKDLDAIVDARPLARSVHRDLGCTDCHVEFSAARHPERSFRSRRHYTEQLATLCRQCHNFADGPHSVIAQDPRSGRVCTDCHGSHNVVPAAQAGSCMGCHKHQFSLPLSGGERLSVHVEPAELLASVHADLGCDDCHPSYTGAVHPKREFRNEREYELAAGEVCKGCHFDKYTRTLEGIHFKLISAGRTDAPGCVDCHGTHGIASGQREKRQSAQRCQRCHGAIYDTYTKSVHGQALVQADNQDVPICSDCHKAHEITDPRTVDFRNETPGMCGGCHANKPLMEKYGLSTAVLESYLEDFHGVTVTFYKQQGQAVRHIAVCTDCHGIHDITRASAHNANVVKSNLVERCRRCHPDASESFPDTWIAHYEPTFKRAPLVFVVDVFYRVFIPFMIGGLVLQILLHIWRYAVKR